MMLANYLPPKAARANPFPKQGRDLDLLLRAVQAAGMLGLLLGSGISPGLDSFASVPSHSSLPLSFFLSLFVSFFPILRRGNLGKVRAGVTRFHSSGFGRNKKPSSPRRRDRASK